ncbi:neurotrypsin-like isoform X2 [Lampetra fluviatilis]
MRLLGLGCALLAILREQRTRALEPGVVTPRAGLVVEGAVRLVGGSGPHEGRVEVYHAGEWGSVCDDQWDERDAAVVCRQLGLPGRVRAWTWARFGEGTGPVWVDEGGCTGNELALGDCERAPWGQHDCSHREDAGVSCDPHSEGAVRLVGGSGPHEGRVEVYHAGEWGSVCDDQWDERDAAVVCRQLGLPGTALVSRELEFGPGSGFILLDEVACGGWEAALRQCGHSEWGRHDCSHLEDAGVLCKGGPETQPPALGPPVRLVEGEGRREGRVEVLVAGEWGTVCDDGWSDKDAAVVCTQLGLPGPARALGMAFFGEGSGPIHLDNVKCSGWERALGQCAHLASHEHNCRHSEDAGVVCGEHAEPARLGDHPGDAAQLADGPLSEVCGRRLGNHRRKRIVGGAKSLRGGWPWQASVWVRAGPHTESRLLCGATLISSCWLLTAAHCFKRLGTGGAFYTVRVGDHHRLVRDRAERELRVERIVVHERYSPTRHVHDIALLRVSTLHTGPDGAEGSGVPGGGTCVPFSEAVRPACLPGRRGRLPRRHHSCFITGWGDTGRSYARTLQEARVSVLPGRLCRLRYGGRFEGGRMVCARGSRPPTPTDTPRDASSNGGIGGQWGRQQTTQHGSGGGGAGDSCQGDSGGPLSCQESLRGADAAPPGGGGGRGGRWVVAAVTSWGHGCGERDSPGVYTRVSRYVAWIHRVTAIQSSQ